MKTRAQISMAVLAVAVGVLAYPIARGETKEANQAQQLEKLLKERQAILRQLVDIGHSIVVTAIRSR